MIYFILQRDTGKLKIGYTKTPATLQKRLKTFACGNPEEIEILHLEPGDRYREAMIHRQFRQLRIDPKHEWFRYTGNLARYVQKCIETRTESEF